MALAGTAAPSPTLTPAAMTATPQLSSLLHLLRAGAHPGTLPDDGVFRHDGVLHHRALFHHGAGHDDGIPDDGALLDGDAGEQDGKIHVAVDIAALGNHAVLHLSAPPAM